MKKPAAAVLVMLVFLTTASAFESPSENSGRLTKDIRAIYLGSSRSILSPDQRAAQKKVDEILELIDKTELNAITLDAKDDSGFNVLEETYGARFSAIVKRFKAKNAYIICRIVTLKDTRFPKTNPSGAIKRALKHADGSTKITLWSDNGRNNWYDPADPEIIAHTLKISKKAVELGCDELNYDYIRFPSPIDGSLSGAIYPFGNDRNKRDSLKKFFESLRDFSKRENPAIPLSADVFGYVFLTGRVPEIGQHLEDIAEYFDVISPMAYPSHYRCGNFGVKDPNTAPYKVYYGTIKSGLEYLERRGIKAKVRPWLQAFSIPNISGCGAAVTYDREKFREQIRALDELGIKSWMAWNARAVYSQQLFNE